MSPTINKTTITYHLNSLNIKQNTIGDPGPVLGHVQIYGGVKPVTRGPFVKIFTCICIPYAYYKDHQW